MSLVGTRNRIIIGKRNKVIDYLFRRAKNKLTISFEINEFKYLISTFCKPEIEPFEMKHDKVQTGK